MDIKDRVLIVEDDKSIRNFLKTVLEANNFDVITAVTGAEAYSMATSQCPDLVILDLGLPDKDGIAFLKEIRKESLTPVIVLSARSDEQDKVEALNLGANDYVTKPFGSAELVARVQTALRTNSHRAENGKLPGGQFETGELSIDMMPGQSGSQIRRLS